MTFHDNALNRPAKQRIRSRMRIVSYLDLKVVAMLLHSDEHSIAVNAAVLLQLSSLYSNQVS